jgi:hypothetical protein
MIAVDGPAPLAKLITQRERRKVRARAARAPPLLCCRRRGRRELRLRLQCFGLRPRCSSA